MFGLLNILVTWQPKMNREESAVFLRRSTLADIVMCLFVLLKNNRIGCAWGPMDHSELADLFITYRPPVHGQTGPFGTVRRCESLSSVCWETIVVRLARFTNGNLGKAPCYPTESVR